MKISHDPNRSITQAKETSFIQLNKIFASPRVRKFARELGANISQIQGTERKGRITDDDIKNRYIYVEASRGCPFECEFCLSSMDEKVRAFNLDELLEEFEKLWRRGARNFKFIDRTFNLNIKIATRLLNFFLEKEDKCSLHFEVIPDHFPDNLKKIIQKFPKGSIQFEIGIQSLNPIILDNINRRMDLKKVEENLHFLEEETNAHLHVDLIVGLPGESLESLAKNLNNLKQ